MSSPFAGFSLPPTLNAPSTPSEKDAITDSIYRAVLGLDTNDITLFRSAMFPDSKFTMNGNTLEGMETIENNMFKHIGQLDTTHFLSNVRVTVESADTAKVSASALAQHYRAGDGAKPDTQRLLAGSLYMIDVKKDTKNGLWKCVHWNMKVSWFEGDMSIVSPP